MSDSEDSEDSEHSEHSDNEEEAGRGERFAALLGPKLLDTVAATASNAAAAASGEQPPPPRFVDTKTALAGKVVGIYFAAHWCPPCRGFTPKLVKLYENIRKRNELLRTANGDADEESKRLDTRPFEIVAVSSDRDEASFYTHIRGMKWLALPFEERDLKVGLQDALRCPGLPTLILVDFDSGEVINKDGVFVASTDLGGVNYPWHPPSVWDAMGSELRSKGGEVVVKEDVLKAPETLRAKVPGSKHKQLALYFGDSKSPSCKQFTPVLVKLYEKMLERAADEETDGASFEFISISTDSDEDEMSEFYDEMPWLALPYERRAEAALLKQRFEISSTPCVVTVEADGTTVHKRAHHRIAEDPTGSSFPWRPLEMEELSLTIESNGFDINEKPAVVLFMLDGSEQHDASSNEASHAAASAGESVNDESEKGRSGADDDDSVVDGNGSRGSGSDGSSGGADNSDSDEDDEDGNSKGGGGNDGNSRRGRRNKGRRYGHAGRSVANAHFSSAEAALRDVASEYADTAKSSDEPAKLLFFTARKDDGPVPQLRRMCGLDRLPAKVPTLVLMNIRDNGAFYKYEPRSAEAMITAQDISTFITAYENGNAPRNQMGLANDCVPVDDTPSIHDNAL